MGKKLPAMQFYPGDWRRNPKVQSLTYEERGLWFEMLCLMHFAEPRGKLPIEDLPILLGINQTKVKQTLAKLLAKGVANIEQNYIICRRMLSESKISELRARAGFQGGSKTQAKLKQKRLELLEVKIYFAEINCPPEEAEKFFDYYESKGWVVGKVPMKSWKAAARNWKRSWLEKNPHLKLKAKPKPPPPPIPWVDIPMAPEEAKELQEAKKKLSFNLQRIGKKIPSEKLQQRPEVLKTLEEKRG